MAKKSASFEESLAQLETIMAELESGDLPLDKMMERYEKGVAALQLCREVLDGAEKKIELLVKTKDGELETKPFETDEED